MLCTAKENYLKQTTSTEVLPFHRLSIAQCFPGKGYSSVAGKTIKSIPKDWYTTNLSQYCLTVLLEQMTVLLEQMTVLLEYRNLFALFCASSDFRCIFLQYCMKNMWILITYSERSSYNSWFFLPSIIQKKLFQHIIHIWVEHTPFSYTG